MPLDTLEELRLLYNLQVGDSKLLQIILFGQPELNAKLDQPNMRQLKDRIVHHFHMQPLSRNVLESYLMFRMRAAGYHGPGIFSPDAVKLIASASNGLMRRVNILADKSLLAAFVEDTHDIKARHVQAAMRDSELKPARTRPGKKLLAGGAVAALLLAGLVAWGALDKQHKTEINVDSLPAPATAAPPVDAPPAIGAQPDNPPVPASGAEITQTAVAADPAPPPEPVVAAVPPAADIDLATGKLSLFEQRMAAGKQLLEQKKAVASIQLFYNETINQKRIEGFLTRADELGVLSEIYLLPAKFGSKAGLRALYGAYPSADAARSEIKNLPKRYREAFAASVYIY